MKTATTTTAAATVELTVGLSNRQLNNRAKKLAELETMKKALETQIEALQNEIKADMGSTEQINTGKYKISWTSYTAHSFDSKAFKASHAKLYAQYSKEQQRRRFSITAA